MNGTPSKRIDRVPGVAIRTLRRNINHEVFNKTEITPPRRRNDQESEMFKGLGQMGDMAKMLKSAQEMQQKDVDLQEQFESMTVEGRSGAGLVTATANGKGDLTALNIDPSIFNPEEKEVVEDLILAAIKDAQIKAKEMNQAEMGKLTEGLGLPADFKMPF